MATAVEPRLETKAPASFVQQRLWLLYQLAGGAPVYHVSHAERFLGELDLAALESAVATVVSRHEALRTGFSMEGSEAMQVVGPPELVPLELVDLEGVPAEHREQAAHEAAVAAAREPFDFRPPLARFRLLRLGPRDHVLVLVCHHAVFDGWSLGILQRELSAAYGALLAGAEPELPPLQVQYADYARAQREAWDEGLFDAQLEYWTTRLAGLDDRLDLPFDRRRPAVSSLDGGTVSRRLRPDLLRRGRVLATAERSTLYMLLLAAFGALLGRYARADELAIGAPVAGRPNPSLHGLIGMFANTVVLRLDLRGDPSFRTLLGRVRETTLAAVEHQDVPFEKVVEAINPPRRVDQTPLYQVMFAHERAGADAALALPGLEVVAFPFGPGVAALDLSVSAIELRDGLVVDFDYRKDLFERETVERMADRYETLLAAALDDPDAPVGELDLLDATERRLALREWAQGPELAEPAGEVCLSELVEHQVDRTPDAQAVSFRGRILRYGELDEAANRLARRLRALGAGPEARVVVCLERSLELVVALLAVLKAGAAYVPLDPDYPEERFRFVLEDAAPAAVVCTEAVLDRVETQAPALVLDRDAAAIEAEDPARLASGAVPDNLAYVIYTSGSTGRPKGALNTHRAIVNRLLWMQETFGLDAGDAVLQKTPFGFDVSVWELFWPLLAGARLVVAEPGGHRDPLYLVDAIRSEGITTLHFVPSMLAAFLEAPGLQSLRSLRRVICSGEALEQPAVDRFAERVGCELYNLYGPTEAAVDVTAWRCAPGSDGSVPIGRPVAGTQTLVLDDRLRPVPPGLLGELCIGGVQVARGYLGRPGLTAERFVPNPYGPGRLYRTGDLARWRRDGTLEFCGRRDGQVKLRGVRIELGEIESVLAAHPAVAAAAAAVVQGSRLAAYATPAGAPPEVSDLRDHLRRALPPSMLPASITLVDELPLSPNGKLDRSQLPAPDAPDLPAARTAPRTETEAAVARIWADVLGVERVGVLDDFFDLGGHSLLAITLVARIEEELGRRPPLAPLFAEFTVERTAALVDAPDAERGGRLVELATGGTGAPIVCVHAIGGTVLPYARAGRLLAGRRTFFALQARGVDGEAEPLEDVEAQAEVYAEAVRSRLDRTPICAGWSYGALVAVELRRRLGGDGPAILIEPPPADLELDEPGSLAAAFAADLELALLGSAEAPAEDGGALFDRLLARLRDAGVAPAADGERWLRALYAVFEANARAAARYRPRPVDFPLALVLGDADPESNRRRVESWQALAAEELRVEVVAGDHFAIWREGAEELAAALAALTGEAPR